MGRCQNIIKLWFNLSDLYAYGPELYKCHCYWKYLKFNYVYGSELCYYYLLEVLLLRNLLLKLLLLLEKLRRCASTLLSL